MALVGVALALAACGSGPSATGVASVGSSTSTTVAAGSPAGNSGSSSPTLQKAQLAYAECMRGHGITNFPDPKTGGGYPDGYMKTIDSNSPQFTSATKGCRSFATAAGMAPWTGAQWAAYDVQLLKISHCMQAHGITNFPDPKGGEQGGFAAAAGPLDQSSPQYAAAAKACNGPPGAPTGSGPAASKAGSAR